MKATLRNLVFGVLILLMAHFSQPTTAYAQTGCTWTDLGCYDEGDPSGAVCTTCSSQGICPWSDGTTFTCYATATTCCFLIFDGVQCTTQSFYGCHL